MEAGQVREPELWVANLCQAATEWAPDPAPDRSDRMAWLAEFLVSPPGSLPSCLYRTGILLISNDESLTNVSESVHSCCARSFSKQSLYDGHSSHNSRLGKLKSSGQYFRTLEIASGE